MELTTDTPSGRPPLQRHYFRAGDRVIRRDGLEGQVVETTALYALVRWAGELRTWVEQHDPSVAILERGDSIREPEPTADSSPPFV
jgi:hypothetical protein